MLANEKDKRKMWKMMQEGRQIMIIFIFCFSIMFTTKKLELKKRWRQHQSSSLKYALKAQIGNVYSCGNVKEINAIFFFQIEIMHAIAYY